MGLLISDRDDQARSLTQYSKKIPASIAVSYVNPNPGHAREAVGKLHNRGKCNHSPIHRVSAGSARALAAHTRTAVSTFKAY